MFGFTKRKLRDFMFKKKEELALKISELIFSYDESRM